MSLELENSGNLNVKVPCLLVVYRPPAVAYSDLDFFIEVTCPKYLSLSIVLLLPVSSSMYIFLLLPVLVLVVAIVVVVTLPGYTPP